MKKRLRLSVFLLAICILCFLVIYWGYLPKSGDRQIELTSESHFDVHSIDTLLDTTLQSINRPYQSLRVNGFEVSTDSEGHITHYLMDFTLKSRFFITDYTLNYNQDDNQLLLTTVDKYFYTQDIGGIGVETFKNNLIALPDETNISLKSLGYYNALTVSTGKCAYLVESGNLKSIPANTKFTFDAVMLVNFYSKTDDKVTLCYFVI